jgi:tetratricopeptide (TPR) repeat protein
MRMTTKTRLSIKPDPVPAKLREIGSLVHSKDLAKAEAEALKLLQAYPKRPDVHNILGVVYIQNKKSRLAVPHLEFASKAEPQNSVYLNNLGRLYLELRAIELALPFLHNALAINPKLTTTLISIGEYYLSVGKAALGLPYLERALANEPNNKKAKWQLAESLNALGRTDEANRLCQELRLEGAFVADGLYRISRNNNQEQNVPLLAEAEELLKSDSLPDAGRSKLHSAIGFMLEKEGRYEAAFDHFDRANRLAATAFDSEVFRAWVDRVTEIFTADMLRERAHLGSESRLPVLVVGMPRSGTTLTEQMIASHRKAGGAGELMRIPLFAKSLKYSLQQDIGKFVSTLNGLGPRGIREMADNYVSLLHFHAPGAERVVDKLPHNFLYLGLVALLCPNARIVHCSRNPADTCLSCFQNPLSEGHPYSRNLTNLGLYYREYSRLVEHWKAVLPMPIYHLNYEKFTSDFEGESRRLIDFIGLPWDDACLKFYEAESTVRTFSQRQVRNPVYQSSVERWRRYETNLQPLISALGDLMKPNTNPSPS